MSPGFGNRRMPPDERYRFADVAPWLRLERRATLCTRWTAGQPAISNVWGAAAARTGRGQARFSRFPSTPPHLRRSHLVHVGGGVSGWEWGSTLAWRRAPLLLSAVSAFAGWSGAEAADSGLAGWACVRLLVHLTGVAKLAIARVAGAALTSAAAAFEDGTVPRDDGTGTGRSCTSNGLARLTLEAQSPRVPSCLVSS